MQAKTSDPNAYYSCDDQFSLVEKAIDCDQQVEHSHDDALNLGDTGAPSSEGM